LPLVHQDTKKTDEPTYDSSVFCTGGVAADR